MRKIKKTRKSEINSKKPILTETIEAQKIESTLDFISSVLSSMSKYCQLTKHPKTNITLNTIDIINLEENTIETVPKPNIKYSDESCIICFTHSKKIKYPCGHEICKKCSLRWEKINKSCPICRHKI